MKQFCQEIFRSLRVVAEYASKEHLAFREVTEMKHELAELEDFYRDAVDKLGSTHPKVMWLAENLEACRTHISKLTTKFPNPVYRFVLNGEVKWRSSRSCNFSTGVAPPKAAEFLVGLFAKKRHRAGLLECLDEEFRDDLASGMSVSRAKRRYWAAALNSIGPQLWAAIRRIGVIGIVADYFRGKLGGA